MDQIAAHAGQHGAHLLEQRLGGADHEGQRAGLRADGAAGNRGIGQRIALGLRGGRELAHGGRIDGAGIDQRHAGAHAGEHAVFAKVGAAHVCGGGQHGDDEIRFRHGLARGVCAGGAFGAQRRDGGGIEVEHGQGVAGLEQVARHGRAHVAEADEGDMHGVSPSAKVFE
ncbi:hypothetical protein D9M68_762300 [compost metagenome]